MRSSAPGSPRRAEVAEGKPNSRTASMTCSWFSWPVAIQMSISAVFREQQKAFPA